MKRADAEAKRKAGSLPRHTADLFDDDLVGVLQHTNFVKQIAKADHVKPLALRLADRDLIHRHIPRLDKVRDCRSAFARFDRRNIERNRSGPARINTKKHTFFLSSVGGYSRIADSSFAASASLAKRRSISESMTRACASESFTLTVLPVK